MTRARIAVALFALACAIPTAIYADEAIPPRTTLTLERVIDMLRAELELVMKQCGVTSANQIGRGFIGTR